MFNIVNLGNRISGNDVHLIKHKQSSSRIRANWTEYFIKFSFCSDAGLMPNA